MTISSVFAEIARHSAVPVTVGVAFALARKYMPVRAEKTPISHEFAEDFSTLQWIMGVTMFAVGGVFAYLSYILLIWTNRTLATHDGPAVITLFPEGAIWFFFPFFGAICLCWEITFQLWKLFGDRDKAEKYAAWSNIKTGFNATRLLRFLAIFIVLPIAIFTFMAVPLHTSFREDGLKIGKYARFRSAFYRYSDVKSLTLVEGNRLRDGSLQSSPAVVLTFADGSRWSSSTNRGIQKKIDPALLELLQKKTQLQPESIEAESFGK